MKGKNNLLTKNSLMLILVLIVTLVSLCSARQIGSLNRTQIEIKYGAQLKNEAMFICPTSESIGQLKKSVGFSNFAQQRGNQRIERLESRGIRSLSARGQGSLTTQSMETESMIEIGGAITNTLKLQSGQVYHAISDVIVDGGYLIHEPGAVVKWASDTGLYVRNGGTYLARGFPWDLCTHMADVDNPWTGYWKGILIEESASNNCEIKYSFIWDAVSGIELRNQTLKEFIEHNVIGYCGTGIKVYGPKHTKITNNFCYNNQDYYWNGYNWVPYGAGIQCFYRSYEGLADPNESVVDIEQNTCLWNYDEGIRVHMIDEYTQVAPIILNNVSAGNYWNYSFEDGLALANLVLCNGSWLDPDRPGSEHIWYFNPEDWGIIIEDSPTSPFTGFYTDAIFLDQSCAFIDAGLMHILDTTYMGQTTSIDNTPDSGKIDLGFHYSNWDYSNAGSSTLKADVDNSLAVDVADLSVLAEYWLFNYDEAYEVYVRDGDGSGTVDFGDLQIIAENWLTYPFDFHFFAWWAQCWQEEVDPRVYNQKPDLNNDGLVNFVDFAILANEYGQTADADPNIQINVYVDSESTYAEVGISNYRQDTAQAFLLVDGCFEDDMFGFRDGRTSKVNLARFSGYCEFKVVSFNDDERITCSNLKIFDFNSPMQYMRCPEVYYANEPDYFCVFSGESNDICVKASDIEQNVVWTQTYSVDNATGLIPASITAVHEIEVMEFELVNPSGEMSLLMEADIPPLPPIVKVTKTKGFKPKDVPTNTDSLIILPDNWTDYWVNKHVTDVVRATFDHEFELKGREATTTNMAWFAQNRNIKYVYYSGHGNYEFGGKLRTGIKYSDGVCFSVRLSDYPDSNQAPSWCDAMGGAYENGKNLSFAQMGFTTLEYSYFDCCFSGRLKIDGNWNLVVGQPGSVGILDAPYSDISWALGGGFCQGWYDECPHGKRSTFSKFSKDEFEKLRDGETLYQALMYAISKSEIDPQFLEDPAEHFRLKGLSEDLISFKID